MLVHGCSHPACLALVRSLREHGRRVEIDVLDLNEKELSTQARQRGIPRTLWCIGDEWLLTDAQGERALTKEALLQKAERWNS